MANKKNLPNIPIYIGDWERDCNVLSLESEAAWMRIVFKLWTNGKQNTIKIPTKSLQNLWRCSTEKVGEILEDLIFNKICEVNKEGVFVEFTCRRFVKENEISEIRSEASKGIKRKTKTKQTINKTKTKAKQNAENEIDYENEIEIKTEKGGLGEKIKFPFDNEVFRTQWQHWKIYKKKEFKFNFKSEQSEQASLTELANLSNGIEKKAIAIIHQSMAKGWKGFFELKNNDQNEKRNDQSGPSDEYRRDLAKRLGIVRTD